MEAWDIGPLDLGSNTQIFCYKLNTLPTNSTEVVESLFNKFPIFYRNWHCNAMFTTSYSWSLSEPNESSLHHSSPFFKNHFNIILLHIPRSSRWCISNGSHILHLCQSHLPWFDHSHNIPQQVVFRKLSTVHFSPDSRYFHPSRSKYSLQYPLLKHHKSMCFL